MKTCAVIAAYNEEKHIEQVVKKTRKYVDIVIVGDDGSKDNTALLAKKAGAFVVSNPINKGKGSALKLAADKAVKEKAGLLVFLDGDGQHDPAEIPKFLRALEKTDMVFGARRRDKNMPSIYRFGNWFLNTVVLVLYRFRLHDTQGGYRAMTTSAYKKIRWDSDGYSVESEMIANTSKAQLSYKEIFVKTIYLEKYKGTTPLDGFPIMWNLLKWRFQK